MKSEEYNFFNHEEIHPGLIIWNEKKLLKSLSHVLERKGRKGKDLKELVI